MKTWVTLVAAAMLLAGMAPLAAAQDGMPTAGVTQVHGDDDDWGYVGVAPIFGFSFGERFDLLQAGYSSFSTNALLGMKAVLGLGSNDEGIGSEIYITGIQYSYSGILALDGREVNINQWLAKVGFNIISEFVDNESISDEGEVIKDGTIGISGFFGFYWLAFPDGNFDLVPQDPTNDSKVEDDTLWTRMGLLFEIPVVGNVFQLTFFAAMDLYLYNLDRMLGLGEVDSGDINFQTFSEKFQMTFGGMMQFTPFLVTDGGGHWRFFVGAQFTIIENPQPNQLMISAGLNFGW